MGNKDFEVLCGPIRAPTNETYADQTTARDAKRLRPHSFEDDLAGYLLPDEQKR